MVKGKLQQGQDRGVLEARAVGGVSAGCKGSQLPPGALSHSHPHSRQAASSQYHSRHGSREAAAGHKLGRLRCIYYNSAPCGVRRCGLLSSRQVLPSHRPQPCPAPLQPLCCEHRRSHSQPPQALRSGNLTEDTSQGKCLRNC